MIRRRENSTRSWKNWLTALEKLKQEKSKDGRLGEEVEELATHVEQLSAQIADVVDAKKFGYEDMTIKDGDTVVYNRPAIEELIRWRLWDRTGAGPDGRIGEPSTRRGGHLRHAMHKAAIRRPRSSIR